MALCALLLSGGCGGESQRRPVAGPATDGVPVSGGRLVAALRADPRTLNPVHAVDRPSQEVIQLIMADLLDINRLTQEVEPALASSLTISDDGLTYRLELRRGVRFSDGEPFDADDVVFSFRVYLDEAVAAPGRDLLIVGGRPIEARKLDSHTLEFLFAEPYAAGSRLFEGFSILPQHLLEQPYLEGRLAEAWAPATPPAEIAGLGPFRLREYRSGERLVLERNPHYWKLDDRGVQLPYLDELALLIVASEDAQVIRFEAGETDVIEQVSPGNFLQLERAAGAETVWALHDLGPALSYVFLLFNQNDLGDRASPELARRQGWFRQLAFRQAISAAVDRDAVVRLAYRERATPIWSNVSPGYRYWYNESLPRPGRSLEGARALLRDAGFRWQPEDRLLDPSGQPVEFSIITGSSNSQRMQAATLVQEDLRQLGMKVTVTPLEHRAVIERLLGSRDYEACLMELGGADADPNPQINVLLSSGGLHLWRLDEPQPATSWEAEIDELMRRQLSTMDRDERKRLFDRVQLLMAENVPFVFLVSPHVLAGGKKTLGGFQPAALRPHTLWNADRLFWRSEGE